MRMSERQYEGPSGCIRGRARARPRTYRRSDLPNPTNRSTKVSRSRVRVCLSVLESFSPCLKVVLHHNLGVLFKHAAIEPLLAGKEYTFHVLVRVLSRAQYSTCIRGKIRSCT